MCNCGKKIISLKSQHRAIQKNIQPKVETSAQKNQVVMFKYIGNTALNVTGNFTRKNYRFNFPGDIQPVESIDSAGMAAVPVLKKI